MKFKKITLKKDVVAKISNNEMAGLLGGNETKDLITAFPGCPEPTTTNTPVPTNSIICGHTCGTE